MAKTQTSSPIIEYVLLVVLAALWGGSFTLIKVALESYPPATIVTIRMAIARLLLLSIALLRREDFPKTRSRWLELLFQGILQSALPFFLITWGEKHIDSSVAGLLNSTPPMFVFLITVFIIRTENFDVQKLIGIILGTIGVIFFTQSASGGVSESNILAILAVTGASCSYACGAIYGRRFQNQSVFITASCSLVLATFLIGPFAFYFEDLPAIDPTLRSTLAIIALALFSTALASLIFFRLIKKLGSLATTSNAYIRALFSILFGMIFLSEPLSISLLLATILILLGVFLVTGQFRNLVTDKLGKKENEN